MRKFPLPISAVAALVFAGVGCSHKVDSPAVTVEAVQPDLICNGQRSEADLNVTVTGSGFTPQPVKVLAGDQKLILPSIELTRTQDLSGGAVSSGGRLFPGDPDEDYSGNLVWDSDTTMRFRVVQDTTFGNAMPVNLESGIYDLTLTNPDEHHSDTLEAALAVVDPPSIASVAPVPPSLCIEQEPRTLEIAGASFVTIDDRGPTVQLAGSAGAATISGTDVVAEECAALPGSFAGGTVSLCKKLLVSLPQGGSLPGGIYGITVTSPSPADCSSSETVDVLIVDPPSITALDPTATCVQNGARQVQVSGDSFARVQGREPTVTLTAADGSSTEVGGNASGCTPQSSPATDFMTDICNGVSFSAEPSMSAGVYGVSVTNRDPVGCETQESFELLVVDAPTIVSIDPGASCIDGADQQVTLTGNSFATVGTALPVITFTDAGGMATDFAANSIDGCSDAGGLAGGESVQLCTSLVFTLPATTAQGGYAVTVRNPAPIDCESSQAVDYLVVEPPSVTEAIADAVCIDGASQEVRVVGTSFVSVGDALPIATLTDAAGGTIDITADSVAGCGGVLAMSDGAEVRLCTEAVITIPADAVLGDYAVSVTNPAPASCSSADSAPLAITAPPVVNTVEPGQLCSGGSELLITGSGFRTGATVTVLCDAGDGTTHVVDSLASEASADGTSLRLRFGFGAVPDETCDVIVSNAMDCDSSPPHPQIAAIAGPIVFYSAPPVAYNGINTQIKLFMTTITGTSPEVKIVPTGAISGEIVLATTIDPANDRRLQALVPKDTPAGTYDILVSDDTGCAATLVGGLVVTDTLTIALEKVVQPFGNNGEQNAVTIFRTEGSAVDNVPFTPTPTAFLNPKDAAADEPAIQLVGVTYVDDITLTAVVPDGVDLGDYDLVVVDADGNVGVLSDAYRAIDVSPPEIENVFPQSIVNADQYDAPDGSNVDQVLTAFGENFTAATVELICESPDGMSVAPASVGTGDTTCDVDGCTITVPVDGSGLSPGDVCLVRVTNDDGSYADYSAVGVTNPSRNLSNPSPGEDLITARRACGSSAVQATSAARFVYAIGGDGGPAVADAPFASVEFAPVGVFGGMQPFVENREPLNVARAFAGTETVGRYVYVFGGSDGTDALMSAERALVLSPAEIPVITDIDLCLSGGASDCFGSVPSTDGLLTGEYAYRISAVIDAASSRNLGGETLASDPIIVRLPEIVAAGETRRVAIQLFWDPPVDKLGTELEDIVGYRIYRTPADGIAAADELLIGEVAADVFDFIDGGAGLGSDSPLPQGSTSAWQVLPDLNTARNALASAVARDPDSASGYFVYALLGMDSGATDTLTATALTNFEYLNIEVLPNDRQDLVGSWAESDGGGGLEGRFLHGAWSVDQQVFSDLGANETYIYVGGGRIGPGNGDVVGSIENLQVQVDGNLVYNTNNPVQASEPSRSGFATMAAFGRLFVLGGADPKPKGDASSARIVSVDEVSTSFNNEGIQLVESRYVPGRSIQSAFLFLVGGQTTITTDSGGAIVDGDVTASTEYIVW
ncbi:MAG: hypothetical protein OEZ06_09825 [Myxococcales bacterium]|nr:hypothetical protein [Myxococcales bacterium]